MHKKLRQYENMPTREKIGFDIKRISWYEDIYKKSANQEYGRGTVYFNKCAQKYKGKPVETLIFALRKKCAKAHRSFKKAVEDCIYDELLKTFAPHLRWVYLGYYTTSEGLVGYTGDLPKKENELFSVYNPGFNHYSKEVYKYSNLYWDLNQIIQLSPKGLGVTDYAVRLNGIHYFVELESELDMYKYTLNFRDPVLHQKEIDRLKLILMRKADLLTFNLTNKGDTYSLSKL